MRAVGLVFCLLWVPSAVADSEESQPPDWWRMDFLPARIEDIRTSAVVARFYTPKEASGPWQPVVLLSGSEGGMVKNQKRIDTLIACGYCVMTPAYFGEEGLPSELISVPLEFFEQVLTWLEQDGRVTPGAVAVMGGSKGGELALLLATRYNEIKVVIAAVPSAYVFQGIARRYHNNSSWSDDGKDLPFLPYSMFQAMIVTMGNGQYRPVYEAGWQNRKDYPEARIPVETANSAILLLSGKKDTMWPSTPMCEEIVTRLQNANYPHPYEHLAYDCGHEVGARRDHLIKMTEFLRDHYQRPVPATVSRGTGR